MSRTFPSRVQEEYLEALFELSAEGREPVGVVRLAESMAVARSTVVAVVARLKKHGFVVQEPYGKVELTAEGRDLARSLKRREAALYDFLTELLGVDDETARREACALEHSLSPGTRERLVRFLQRHRRDGGGKDRGTGKDGRPCSRS